MMSHYDGIHAVRKHLIWAVVALTIADRMITVPNWHLEANPIVRSLGPSLWTLITIGLIVGLVYLWYHSELYRSDIAVGSASILYLLTAAIVGINLFVVIS